MHTLHVACQKFLLKYFCERLKIHDYREIKHPRKFSAIWYILLLKLLQVSLLLYCYKFGWNSGVSRIDGQHYSIFVRTHWVNKLTPKMPLGLLFLASLILSYLPLSLSYRDGARSESCYNMLVEHRNFLGQIVSPMECGSSCHFQLILIGRLADCRLAPIETTYQCGETYHCK